MLELDEFELALYEESYAEQRWMYLPRCEGDRFGLAIAVVGQPGKILVPLDLCCADDFNTIKDYVQRLNQRRINVASAA